MIGIYRYRRIKSILFYSANFILIFLFILFFSVITVEALEKKFEATPDGIFYVERLSDGRIIKRIKPNFDPVKGEYYVKDEESNKVIYQQLPSEALYHQIKIVTPVNGNTHNVKSKDFLGNDLPVLKELPSNDIRYQQLKAYLDNDPGLKKIVAMHLQARDFKITSLQNEITARTKDPQLAAWLINDLKKPIYLEIGDNGNIYHDPRGFILAEQAPNGTIVYRDNSYVNRLVIPHNSEVFKGGMSDPSAASVIAHEIGHMIMDQVYETPYFPRSNYNGPHSKNTITDEKFAYFEGWAEAIETLSNSDRLNDLTSWRLKTQKNIVENKYIFKNHGAIDGPNDGIIKNGIQQLSTEGVNATLFYKLLTDHQILMPYSKILAVFEKTKPQTYREFIKNYIQMFPEDRSIVIRQFLENTKYTTVDSSAVQRYKELHDAKMAYENAADPTLKVQLEQNYKAKLAEYNRWKEELYKQAVVDGNIDKAITDTGNIASNYELDASQNLNDQYRQVKLKETMLRTKTALNVGAQRALESIKQSFDPKNIAITAGTAVAINLVNQIFSGEKVSLKKAFKSIASLEFVGNVVGSSLGAAAGHIIAPVIQTFVPIPVVATLANALLPTFTAIVGGKIGGNIGSGMTIIGALKNLDLVSITGQAVGSTVGSILGSFIPVPVLGTILGSIVGSLVGEKVFTSIAKLFGYKKSIHVSKFFDYKAVPNTNSKGYLNNKVQSSIVQYQSKSYQHSISTADTANTISAKSTKMISSTSQNLKDYSHLRIDPSIDCVPIEKMIPSVKELKEKYEALYSAYVKAMNDGNEQKAKAILKEYIYIRDRYRRALSAYIKR